MTSEVSLPTSVIFEAWSEYRYPQPATDEPTARFSRAIRAIESALPGIMAAELDRLIEDEAVNVNESGYHWRGIDVEDLRRRASELRGEGKDRGDG